MKVKAKFLSTDVGKIFHCDRVPQYWLDGSGHPMRGEDASGYFKIISVDEAGTSAEIEKIAPTQLPWHRDTRANGRARKTGGRDR